MSAENADAFIANGPGAVGFLANSGGIGVGAQVLGQANGVVARGTNGDGVTGTTNNGGGTASGVHGINTSNNSFGVLGEAALESGGSGLTGIGVVGTAGVGVWGSAFKPEGTGPFPFPRPGEGVIGDGQTNGSTVDPQVRAIAVCGAKTPTAELE